MNQRLTPILRHGRGLLGIILILVVFGVLAFLLRNWFVAKPDSPPPAVVAQQPTTAPAAFNPEQIIPGRQIGPITIGMTQDEVLTALGSPTQRLNKMWEWRKPQMSVGYGPDSKVLVILAGGVGASPERVPFRTPEGIAMGATAEQVIGAWGTPESDRSDRGPSGGVSRQVNYTNRGIQLMFYDGKLTWLSVRPPTAATVTTPATTKPAP